MPQCNNCIHNEVCITYADMRIKDALNITDKEIADFECEYYDNRDNVQQVVRCKDCKHLKYDRDFTTGRYCSLRNVNGGKYCKDDDFCSYGKRMDGDKR